MAAADKPRDHVDPSANSPPNPGPDALSCDRASKEIREGRVPNLLRDGEQ
eukprot:SAG11_NODE_21548_length_423_cov_0.790123_2_plen_49_part_01